MQSSVISILLQYKRFNPRDRYHRICQNNMHSIFRENTKLADLKAGRGFSNANLLVIKYAIE